MTTTTNPSANSRRQPPRTRRRRAVAYRLAIGVAVAGGALTSLGLSADDAADAAPSTASAVVAGHADRALQALDRWTTTQHPVDYIRFVQMRDQAAATTEEDLELAAGSLRDAWAGVSIAKQEALLSAISQLGVPYRNLASEEGVGFDCSGLTIWAFAQAGVDIPRISRDQIRAAETVDHESAEPGDLVYYPGHVSMYLGADVMVHSPYTGSHVEIVQLPSRSLQFGDAVESAEATPVESADVEPAAGIESAG